MHAAVQTHRRLLLLLVEEALSPADHRGVGAHEGDDVLLDLLAVKQGTPADAATIINTLDHCSEGDNTPCLQSAALFCEGVQLRQLEATGGDGEDFKPGRLRTFTLFYYTHPPTVEL